jgi:hypothetical protein
VLPTGSGPYTLVAANAACSSAGNLALVNADNTINYYDGSASATSPALNDAAGFNAQLFSVLKAATSGLAVGDKITVGAKGIITGAELVAPSAANIPLAMAVLDDVTISTAAVTIASATLTLPKGKLTIAAGGVLTISDTAGILATSAGTIIDVSIADGLVVGSTNTVTFGEAVITTPVAETALATGTTGAVLLAGNGSTVGLAAGGSVAVAGTGSLVVGSGGNTVTIDLATVTATAAEPKFADGATGVVTLSDTNTITFATTGTIVVAGTGKVELANTTHVAGTYTSTGATVNTSQAAGDEIVTDTTADDGLAIGTGSNTITLYAVGSAAATFTLTDTTDSTAGKITLGAAGITLPAATGSGATGAILGVSGTSNVGGIAIAGTSGLTLGGGGGTNQPATIAFASTGGLLKGFTHGSNVGTPIKIVAGTVEVPLVFGTNAAFAFTYSNDTCTATTDSVTLKGPTTGTATIDVNSVPAAT